MPNYTVYEVDFSKKKKLDEFEIGRTLIDMAVGELIIRANDEQVVFNIFKEMKFPVSTDDYFLV